MSPITLSGVWKMTQHWAGQTPYSFKAEFHKNGTITIPASPGVGPFFGVYVISGNEISMAIADFKLKQQSITSYLGKITGHVMGGLAEGAVNNGKSTSGQWSAVEITVADLEGNPLEQLIAEN